MKVKPGKDKAPRAPFEDVVAGLMPVARGSLAMVRKSCGKPGCRACRSGRKHPAWLFVYREGGKQKSRHVPAEFAASIKRDRFFQWVCNPEVVAENNLAERRLRPLVIARKVCFGSQSEKGPKTRETLMTIIDTLSLRHDDPVAKLSQALDAIGRDKKANVSELLWGQP